MNRRVAACALALTASAALADLTLVSEAVSQGKKRLVTMSVKGSRALFEFKEAEGSPRSLIRDGDAKKMWIVDHDRKQVVVVTEEDSKALEARQAQFKQQLQGQLEKLPPEQRARIEATMLAPTAAETAKPPVVTFEKKKSAPRQVNGFTCEDYVIKRDGNPAGEGCLASWKSIGLSQEEIQKTLSEAIPSQAMAGPFATAFEHQSKAPGFPVQRTMVDASGTVINQFTVQSIAKTALPAERFVVPSGYAEKVMNEFMGKQRPGVQ